MRMMNRTFKDNTLTDVVPPKVESELNSKSLILESIYIVYTIVQMRSDIAVSEFPDYVLRMTEEDEHNNSMLSYEYWVFNIIMYYNI